MGREGFVIRSADLEDIPQVEALVALAFEMYIERIGRTPASMEADYSALVRAGELWVLAHEATVIGIIALREAEDHLLVSNVAVSPKFQGRGLGKQLLDFAALEAKRHGVAEMRLYTNELMHENIAMYSKLGWKKYAAAEEDGFRRVFMKKAIELDAG